MVGDEDTMAVALRHWRFTVDQYHRMGETGILHEDERVELIEGEIIAMAPIGTRHVATVARIDRLFQRRLQDDALVIVQSPLLMKRLQSEPEPDVMLLKPRADDYGSVRPEPDDVLLLIEVSDSSLAYDRHTKLPLYARAGVTECWLVDLESNRVEIHRAPGDAGYHNVILPRPDEAFAPAAFPALALTLRDLLG